MEYYPIQNQLHLSPIYFSSPIPDNNVIITTTSPPIHTLPNPRYTGYITIAISVLMALNIISVFLILGAVNDHLYIFFLASVPFLIGWIVGFIYLIRTLIYNSMTKPTQTIYISYLITGWIQWVIQSAFLYNDVIGLRCTIYTINGQWENNPYYHTFCYAHPPLWPFVLFIGVIVNFIISAVFIGFGISFLYRIRRESVSYSSL